LLYDQAFRLELFRMWELSKTLDQACMKTLIGPLSLPLLYLVSNGSLVSRRRMNFDETSLQLYCGGVVPNDFETVSTPKIEVRLTGNEFPHWRAGEVLPEIANLPTHPTGPLADPPQNVGFRCRDRGDNLDGGIG
jgi:hypothetical protein